MLEQYKWLERATSKIRFGPDREAVRRELMGHMEDLRDHYIEQGMPEEEALSAALRAMGSPEDIAEDLGRLHRPWLGYLWRFSQGLLLAAAGVCLALVIWGQYRSFPYFDLPGADLYDYLTWEFMGFVGEFEVREIAPGAAVSTGGYTIRVESASLRRANPEERWTLDVNLHIDTGWRGEELYWGSSVIQEIRDSTGLVHGFGTDHWYNTGCSEAVWGLGQKAGLWLDDVPEEAEWVELDVGYGSLMRTLHIDLTREAGA